MSQTPHAPLAGPPAGLPGPMPELTLASSIAPSDNSTSIVIALPKGPQIQTGRVPLVAHADITYATRAGRAGQARELRLDLLVPESSGPNPLVVYLPGGGFVMSRKEMGSERRAYVAEAGYAVASIEYRTVLDGATYTDAVADVKSALRFLRAFAGEYGIDADRVAVWGESAGGYLAAMAGAVRDEPAVEAGDYADQSSAVDAVVNQFGASDLLKLADDFDPAFRAAHFAPATPAAAFVFGPGTTDSLDANPAAVAAADPASYVHPGTPPHLHFHGTADRVVSPSQTLLLHSALLARGVESTRYVLSGADHGDLAAMFGDPDGALPWSTQEVLGYIIDFLDKHLKA
jgi:acetyl esterase/lipase